MIILSIDVTQLDKTRFKKVTRKNGKQAVFCELILVETPESEYGDYMVKESATKEERAARKQFPIVGNAKIVGEGRKAAPSTEVMERVDEGGPVDDVPF